VQLAGGCPKKAMKLQASGQMARSLGAFAATVLSIPLLAAVSARTLISLSGLLSLATAAAACYLTEQPVGPRQTAVAAAAATTAGGGGRTGGGGGRAGAGGGGLPPALPLPGWCLACGGCGGMIESMWRGWCAVRPCFTRRMAFAAAFLFSYSIMPTAGVGSTVQVQPRLKPAFETACLSSGS